MSTATFHKHDEMDDLLAMASDILTGAPASRTQGSARDAARALAGLASWVANRVGVVRMQEAMAEVVRHGPAWKAPFMRDLPAQYNGLVDEYVAMVAVVTSSMVNAYGAKNMRSAMAFWATERDPAQWQLVVGQ